ncbi:MAG: DNA translocase FtsK 4TM domain-containing protein [Chthoniobacter sp.]
MARAQETHSHPLHEVLSLVYLGFGTLLYLALISYAPTDVPSWFPLSSLASPRGPVLNFVGRSGAIVACSSYAFLGAASYLLAALLLGYGGAKLLNPEMRLSSRAWWSIAFVASGACLAHLLPWSLLDMERLNIAGPGGWVGKWIGGLLLKNLLGTVGSTIVLLVVYVSSLILLTGLHPIGAARQIAGWPSAYLEKYRARRMARADEKERLQLEAERLERNRKKLEKTLAKRGSIPVDTSVEPLAPAVAELFAETRAHAPRAADHRQLPASAAPAQGQEGQVSAPHLPLVRRLRTAFARPARSGGGRRPPGRRSGGIARHAGHGHRHARAVRHQRLARRYHARPPPSPATKSTRPRACGWTRS